MSSRPALLAQTRPWARNGVMITLENLRGEKRAAILQLGEKYGARNIRVVGSVARGDNGPESDIDSLVDLDPGRNLFDLGGLLMDLQDCSAWRSSLSPQTRFAIFANRSSPRPNPFSFMSTQDPLILLGHKRDCCSRMRKLGENQSIVFSPPPNRAQPYY